MSNLLEQASLVMIPSGYKEDIVYSVIPTSGAGDLTFTRASNGTRVNSAGLVEVVPWNLATNSENFTLWNLANVTVTANDITAPNGTLTADKLTISNNANDVKQTISVMPNSVYTWTFYVYGGTALGQQGRFYDNTNGANIEYYSYSSSVVLGQWVKIERTFTTPSGCYEIQAWVLAATSTIGTMWAWGAQLNIGSTAKPYFPTTDRLNVPRLTYQNGGGGCPSLLLEKQSTNIALWSEQFDNANWIKNGTTVTANNRISPDGTQDADSVNFSGGGPIEQLILFAASNQTHTVSVWAKVASGTQIFQLKITQAGVVDHYSGDFTATTEWQRFTFTQAFGSGGIGFYTGVNCSGGTLDLWGFQLEPNTSYATSYIPTTSSSATRVADACYKTGISSLIGQTEGTIYGNFYVLPSPSESQSIWLRKASGGLYGDIIFILVNNSQQARAEVGAGGASQFSYTSPTVISEGWHKFALAYKANDFAFYIDGVQMATDSSGSVPACDEMYLGYYPDGGVRQTSQKEAILFPTRLTNSELAQLTGNQNYTINQAYESYGVASESPNCVQP